MSTTLVTKTSKAVLTLFNSQTSILVKSADFIFTIFSIDTGKSKFSTRKITAGNNLRKD